MRIFVGTDYSKSDRYPGTFQISSVTDENARDLSRCIDEDHHFSSASEAEAFVRAKVTALLADEIDSDEVLEVVFQH